MNKKTLGVVIAIVVVIIIGIYMWGGNTSVSSMNALQPAAVSQASSSDEVSDIEAGLNFSDSGPDLSGLN